MSAFRLAILLCFAGALCAGGCAHGSRQEVARVLDKPIYADEITPTPEELAALRDPDAVPAEQLREERRARITSRIIRPLEARYVRQHRLEPTESEIEQFIQGSQARTGQIERKLRADLEDQRAKLAAASTLEEEDAAGLRVEAIEALLALSDAEERRRVLLDDEQRTASDEYQAHSERELAGIWVATWKFHRALYRQFGGGPVAWRESGPEPIAAYRKWLERLESTGDFVIRDPELRELFWGYWRAGADVVVDPRRDPFETPWWLERGVALQPATQSSR